LFGGKWTILGGLKNKKDKRKTRPPENETDSQEERMGKTSIYAPEWNLLRRKKQVVIICVEWQETFNLGKKNESLRRKKGKYQKNDAKKRRKN